MYCYGDLPVINVIITVKIRIGMITTIISDMIVTSYTDNCYSHIHRPASPDQHQTRAVEMVEIYAVYSTH